MPLRGPFLEQREAVHFRHPDVEQHEVWRLPVAEFARLQGIFSQVHAVPLVKQDLGEQFAYAHLVVNYQYFLSRHFMFPLSVKAG